MRSNDERIDMMRERLTHQLQCSQLEIIDDSAKHHGHAGAKTGKGHFTVKIASPSFANKSLIESHRLVYEALGDMMENDIHALSIKVHF